MDAARAVSRGLKTGSSRIAATAIAAIDQLSDRIVSDLGFTASPSAVAFGVEISKDGHQIWAGHCTPVMCRALAGCAKSQLDQFWRALYETQLPLIRVDHLMECGLGFELEEAIHCARKHARASPKYRLDQAWQCALEYGEPYEETAAGGEIGLYGIGTRADLGRLIREYDAARMGIDGPKRERPKATAAVAGMTQRLRVLAKKTRTMELYQDTSMDECRPLAEAMVVCSMRKHHDCIDAHLDRTDDGTGEIPGLFVNAVDAQSCLRAVLVPKLAGAVAAMISNCKE